VPIGSVDWENADAAITEESKTHLRVILHTLLEAALQEI
jgi:hypothetical protein